MPVCSGSVGVSAGPGALQFGQIGPQEQFRQKTCGWYLQKNERTPCISEYLRVKNTILSISGTPIWLHGRYPEPPILPNCPCGPPRQYPKRICCLVGSPPLSLSHISHTCDIISVFCWVENHPYPKVLGQLPLPNKLSPHPMGYNKLGNSPKKCGDTIW